MRKRTIVILIAALALLAGSCTSSKPAPVQVLGAPEDVVALTGQWSGSYESTGTGRSGSITFDLTENPQGARGDVLMVPKQQMVYGTESQGAPRTMASNASVLSIEFVRVAAGEITGSIAPYHDPEMPEATLETHFTGRVKGDRIEGTFVTYSDHGVAPQRGTWKVRRE